VKRLAAAAALLLLPSAAHAAVHPPNVEVEGEDVVGVATVSRTEHRPAIHAMVHSFLFAGHLHFGEGLRGHVFVPFTTGRLDEGGDTTRETSLGNVAGAVDVVRMLGHHRRFEFEILGAAPTALGDPVSETRGDERHATMNALAAAVRGLEDDELYFSRRASVVPRVDFVAEHAGWLVSFLAKVPLLVRSGGASPDPASGRRVNPIAVDGVIAAQAVRTLTGTMESVDEGFAAAVGARAFLDYFFVEPVEEPAEASISRLQFVAESILMLRYGNWRGRFGMLVPFGGRLYDEHERVHSFRFVLGYAR